jgi:hypothetical protein
MTKTQEHSINPSVAVLKLVRGVVLYLASASTKDENYGFKKPTCDESRLPCEFKSAYHDSRPLSHVRFNDQYRAANMTNGTKCLIGITSVMGGKKS